MLISSARTGRRHEAVRDQLQEKRSDHSGVEEQEDLETKRGNEQNKKRTRGCNGWLRSSNLFYFNIQNTQGRRAREQVEHIQLGEEDL